jgi:opacity protein-like surface antigen
MNISPEFPRMKSTIIAAAFAVAAMSGAASAASFTPPAGLAADAAPALEQVNHGGGSCQLGARGWHYHNRLGDRIVCSPRPRGTFYIWREEGGRSGWWHRGYRRWH